MTLQEWTTKKKNGHPQSKKKKFKECLVKVCLKTCKPKDDLLKLQVTKTPT